MVQLPILTPPKILLVTRNQNLRSFSTSNKYQMNLTATTKSSQNTTLGISTRTLTTMKWWISFTNVFQTSTVHSPTKSSRPIFSLSTENQPFLSMLD
jgi:hypothetical protein